MKFNVTFKSGPSTIATVIGIHEVERENLTLGELEQVATVIEPLLEKLTGLRVHVDQV